MGRKTTGIYPAESGYQIDKWYKGQRIRQRGFGSFDEAESWLIAELDRIRSEPSKRELRTFDDAAAHYIELYRDTKKSITSDIYHLKSVMKYIGHLALEQIHNGTLAPFVQERRNQGKKSKTINLSLGAVRRILNLAARDWRDDSGKTWLSAPPMITMQPLTDQRKPRPLMWAEQRRLLPLLPAHLANMALFVLNTGVRDEVACNLQWAWEVPLPDRKTSIFIVPEEHVKGENGKIDQRVVVMNSVAQRIVDSQRGKHETYVFVYRRERTRDPRLYSTPPMEYRPIEAMNNTAWQNARKRAGLGDLHVHDLRHTVGLRLREAGVSEATVSEVLWHKSKTMTQHYSMATINEIHAALELITDERNRGNASLESLIREATAKRQSPNGGLLQKKTG